MALLTKLVMLVLAITMSFTSVAGKSRSRGGKSRFSAPKKAQWLPRSSFEVPTTEEPSGMEGADEGQIGPGIRQRFIPISSFIETNESETKSIAFMLHNTLTPGKSQLLLEDNPDSFYLSSWVLNYPLKILIHDYKDSCEGNFSEQTRSAYLSTKKLQNIICLDWKSFAHQENYYDTVSAIAKVAKRLTDFLVHLKTAGYIRNYRQTHIIGFGVGAHIAGISGHFLNQRKENDTLGRITGLDPSGPGFESVPPTHRLDSSDADFVDVIHTNMGTVAKGFLGTPAFSGHADFFPNGGKLQPVCGGAIVGEFISTCSHQEAYELYYQSIKGTKFQACKCSDWPTFERNECTDCNKRGSMMGEPATKGKASGLLYLHT